MKKLLYSIKETAEALGKSPSWIYQLKNTGEIKFQRHGHEFFTTPEEIRKYRKNHSKKGGH